MPKKKEQNLQEQLQKDVDKTNKALLSIDKELRKVFSVLQKLDSNCRIIFSDALIRSTIHHSQLNFLVSIGLLDHIKSGVSATMTQVSQPPKIMNYVG